MFIKTFTDPQGATHTDAVFMVADAHLNANNSEDFNYDLTNHTPNSSTNVTNTMNYKMYYWTNQASFDAGNLPYILANSDPAQLGEYFYVSNLDSSYDGLTLEQKAEQHCQTVVLA